VLVGVTNVNQFRPAGNDEASGGAGLWVSGCPMTGAAQGRAPDRTDREPFFASIRFLLPGSIFSIILQVLTKG
jgi:hypothetical protein